MQRHQDMLEARKTLIRELSEKHDIPGYDHDLSDHEIHAQQKKLDKVKVSAMLVERELEVGC